MRRLIYILGYALMVVVLFSCEEKFDLRMKGDNMIFVESYPGVEDFIALRVGPAVSLNSDYDVSGFSPDVKLMVNGDMVAVEYLRQGDSLRGIPAGYYVADYAPVPGDRVNVTVSADGFETVESETVVPDSFGDYKLEYLVYDSSVDTKVMDMEIVDGINYNLRLKVKLDIQDSPVAGDAYGIQFVRELDYLVEYPDSIQRDTTLYYQSGQVPDMSDNPLLPQTGTVIDVNFNGISCDSYDGVTMFMDRKFNGQYATLEAEVRFNEDHTYSYVDYQEQEVKVTSKYRYKIRIYKFTPDFSRYAYAQNQIDNNLFGEIGLAPAGYAYSNIKNGAGILAGALMLETDWLDL